MKQKASNTLNYKIASSLKTQSLKGKKSHNTQQVVTHYFQHVDQIVDKFWSIEILGNTFRVTFGKTGTVGHSLSSSFSSEHICLNAAKKLISEKLRNGYHEILQPAP